MELIKAVQDASFYKEQKRETFFTTIYERGVGSKWQQYYKAEAHGQGEVDLRGKAPCISTGQGGPDQE